MTTITLYRVGLHARRTALIALSFAVCVSFSARAEESLSVVACGPGAANEAQQSRGAQVASRAVDQKPISSASRCDQLTPVAALDSSNYAFTSIDVPGAVTTVGRDLTRCAESYVGEFDDKGGHHGFLLQAGNFKAIDGPGAVSTDAHGINSEGDIVGVYRTPTEHGYLLNTDSLTPIDVPNSLATSLQGINDRGDMVGGYCDVAPCAVEGNRGFVASDGEFTSIDFPDAQVTQAWKINARRTVVGLYHYGDGLWHGYLLQRGEFNKVDFPGARATFAFGINNRGDVVGSYCSAPNCGLPLAGNHAYILHRDQFMSFDFPGAIGTRAFGINRHGDIAGAYRDSKNQNHAFLAIRQDSDCTDERDDNEQNDVGVGDAAGQK